MNKNALKAVSTLFAALLVLGMLLAFPIVRADNTVISVLNPDSTHDLTNVDTTYWNASYTYDTKYDGFAAGPGDIIFHSDTHAGEIFYIRVYLTDVTDLYNWQVKLYFDPTLLQCIEAFVPSDSPFNFPVQPSPAIDNSAGSVMLGASLLAGGTPVSGDGDLAWIVFQVVQGAGYGEFYSCDFTLDSTDTFLLDPNMSHMPYTPEPGHYEIFWAVPTIYPYYTIVPTDYTAHALGEDVEIDVYVHDVDPAWEIVGFQFALAFNNTLLEPDHYEAGTFMEPFANDGESMLYVDGHDYLGDAALPPGYNAWTVGVMIMPDENGTWHAPFPEGEGLLVKLHFTAIYEAVFPEVASCDLFFTYLEGNPLNPRDNFNPLAINQYQDEIPIDLNRCIGGTYTAPIRVLGRQIDVYTQYPDPYGGQGPNKPSDMFRPQQEVILYANVTYNEWPEQNKTVAFQVIDPHGNTWAVYYNKTDANGVAWVKFRLPWPCDNPEYYLGEWEVVATVDVAGTVVNDTLTFKYDYLVHIWKVTTDKPSYKHCEYIEATIEYGSYAMQQYDIVITLTAVDETGVPFGYAYIQLTIGGAVYCQYKNDTTTLSVHVVKWARAGIGHIYVCALTDFPFNGGNALYGYEPVAINIEAAWA